MNEPDTTREASWGDLGLSVLFIATVVWLAAGAALGIMDGIFTSDARYATTTRIGVIAHLAPTYNLAKWLVEPTEAK